MTELYKAELIKIQLETVFYISGYRDYDDL